MSCLSWASPIHSSLSDHHSLPRPVPHVGIDPSRSPPKTDGANRSLPRRRKRTKTQQQKQQPSVIQLERALGTGAFSKADSEDTEPRRSILDGILPVGLGKYESPVEKKLRETGEQIISKTERGSFAGKNVLIGMFQWVLPTWILLLLVASGMIKLPFSTPFLDDLLM
ncbi:hypothetical protein MLD38_017555 [Melastoma candidum]|uniref:Uncharacterized protein n=1 Tax=Melastoma candidum TaxID=119954 RepID=A0ACB9QUH5_9MYRT|nr:hypothetical protein MLD38_017555 [Melastoma candidum]